MKKYVIIEADTNDADYVSEKNEISQEDLDLIMPVINAIKEFNEDKSIKYQKYNWWYIDSSKERDKEEYMSPHKRYVESGKVTQEQFEAFWEYTPYFEGGIHTIESVEILEVVNEYKLL